MKLLKKFIEVATNNQNQLLPIPKSMNYEEAIKHYSTSIPELLNAVEGGQRTEGDKLIYETTTKVGTKG